MWAMNLIIVTVHVKYIFNFIFFFEPMSNPIKSSEILANKMFCIIFTVLFKIKKFAEVSDRDHNKIDPELYHQFVAIP